MVMADGKYDEGLFYVKSIMHPPLHANKALKFHLNEQDYFGSYTKLTESLMVQTKFTTLDSEKVVKESAKVQMEPCLVLLNHCQLDKAKNLRYFEELFQGLESMMPEVVVLIGDFAS